MARVKHRPVVFILLLIFISILTAGCGGGAEDGDSKDNGEVSLPAAIESVKTGGAETTDIQTSAEDLTPREQALRFKASLEQLDAARDREYRRVFKETRSERESRLLPLFDEFAEPTTPVDLVICGTTKTLAGENPAEDYAKLADLISFAELVVEAEAMLAHAADLEQTSFTEPAFVEYRNIVVDDLQPVFMETKEADLCGYVQKALDADYYGYEEMDSEEYLRVFGETELETSERLLPPLGAVSAAQEILAGARGGAIDYARELGVDISS